MSNSGIYKLIAKTGEFYIGSATNLNCRKNQHFSMLKLNKHYNKYLQRYVNKHGINSLSFIVIEKTSIDDLIQREQYYIDTLNPLFNGRNKAESNRGHKFSEEAKTNMSLSQRKWRLGRDLSIKLTDEIKKEIIELKLRGYKNIELSKIFNLSLPTISKAIISITTYKRKLSSKDVNDIRQLISKGDILLKDIALQYNVNPSVISNIKAGRLHKF